MKEELKKMIEQMTDREAKELYKGLSHNGQCILKVKNQRAVQVLLAVSE